MGGRGSWAEAPVPKFQLILWRSHWLVGAFVLLAFLCEKDSHFVCSLPSCPVSCRPGCPGQCQAGGWDETRAGWM